MMQNAIAQIWSLVGMFSLLRNMLPPEIQKLLKKWLNHLWTYIVPKRFDPYYHLEIPQYRGSRGNSCNEMYDEVELYLSTLDVIGNARKLTVFRPKDSRSAEFCPASDEVVVDSFQGATIRWSHRISDSPGKEAEKRSFSIQVAKPSKLFLSAYFVHIANTVAELRRSRRNITIYTNNGGHWGDSVRFKHPSSFDSLALDPTMKNKIICDLDRFRQGKEFYSRVGRPWKRGYLLYGPPGTGKSSLVAAIANYMKYNVYDLELTKVHDNSDLRTLLRQTKNKSIIVIEDIDCSLDVTKRLPKPPDDVVIEDKEKSGSRVTLSGLLNSTDGLWSCCGEQQIFIFTTNHKDRLDPALLRSGRMDMHIHLSFCTFPAFKRLAFNYLQIEDHPLFSAVEKLMSEGAEMTPADISEILIGHLDDPPKALDALILALNEKKPHALVSSTSAIAESLEQQKTVEETIPTSHTHGAVEQRISTAQGRGVVLEGPKVVELANGY